MPTILVADDDQLLRHILAKRLEREGYEVLECGDGMAALQIAMEEQPDCLVLDVMMPLARGLEVVRQVRRSDAGRQPAIVMVSARTRVTDRLNALEAGADAYLEKPVEPDALVAAVDDLLEDRVSTRLVDVLGPVWTALALERLAAGALARHRRPCDTGAVERLFDQILLDAVGRRPVPVDAGPLILRAMWEGVLRGLLDDVVDPAVPMGGAAAVPDIAAAIARVVPTRAPQPAPSDPLVDFWAGAVRTALHGRAAGSRVAALERSTLRILRGVLGTPAPRPAAVDWPAVIRRVLRGPELAPAHSWDATIAAVMGGDAVRVPDPLRSVWAAAVGAAGTPRMVEGGRR